jgi:outer membrane lipase/esterase
MTYMKFGFKQPIIFAILTLALSTNSFAESLVIFGDSLSDTGNQHAASGTLSVPPYTELDALRIPGDPYARGGIHFSNGRVWIEHVAAALGAGGDARPALDSKGTAANYAWSGARASGLDDRDLSGQVSAYLADVNGSASDETLYVLFLGGNDVRDALFLGTLEGAAMHLGAALTDIGVNINALSAAGARRFLILNSPDVGLVPALAGFPANARPAATCLSLMFNLGNMAPASCAASFLGLAGIAANLADSGAEVTLVDVFAFINGVAANKVVFGITNATEACVEPLQPPYHCESPNDYLFWDGIHPTKVVHRLLATQVLNDLEE